MIYKCETRLFCDCGRREKVRCVFVWIHRTLYMFFMNEGCLNSAVTVTVSCDRNKTCINVSGNVSAGSAVDMIKRKFPSFNNRFFLQTDITAVPDGYLINIHDKKSIREYLFEYEYIGCIDIFAVCDVVKDIFSLYGEDIFRDVIFDYNVIFINKDFSDLSFVYLPFLSNDEKHVSFKEFLRILFVHMEETDYESEQYVKNLISTVTKWEISHYDSTFYAEMVFCIESYMNHCCRDTKKDVFTKGADVIKKLFGNSSKNNSINNKSMCFMLFSDDKPRQHYLFEYDCAENLFLYRSVESISAQTIGDCLKIGRDANWSNIHIADMTASGRFGIIVFNGECFCMKFINSISYKNTDCRQNGMLILNDGTNVKIGRRLYTVGVRTL